MSKTIRCYNGKKEVDGMIIKASFSHIKGNYNEIRGDYNIIRGDNNLIRGNFNTVYGNNASTYGNFNTIHGHDNSDNGDFNTSDRNKILEQEEDNRDNVNSSGVMRSSMIQLTNIVKNLVSLSIVGNDIRYMTDYASDDSSSDDSSSDESLGMDSNDSVESKKLHENEIDARDVSKYKYEDEDAKSEDLECKICFERKIKMILDCGHPFCVTCLSQIIETNSGCPMCRKEFNSCKWVFL